MQVVHLAGCGTHGKGSMAARHPQTRKKALSLGACGAVQLHALERASPQTQGRAVPQSIQLIFQRGIPQLRPGLQAGIAAVVAAQKNTLAWLRSRARAQRPQRIKCVRRVLHGLILS